jgi:hypothetical protein
MTGMRVDARTLVVRIVTTGSALTALAVAIWLLPASTHIVTWTEKGPVRLALLGPLRGLTLLVGAALVLTGLLAGVVKGDRFRRAAFTLAPIGLLWLWAVPYLPWLPDRLPLLLVLAGPGRWIVAAAVCLSVLFRMGALDPLLSLRPSLDRRWVFGISLAVYLAFGLYSARTNGPRGDEPHYLIIIESLLKDGDLKIENNHARGDYRSFLYGDVRPDYLQRGKNGEIYSIHPPGLPVLLLPAYAVGGYLGAVAMLCCLAALAALAVFDLSALVAGRRAATLTWIAVCLTIPFVPHTWLIFPEMAGTVVVAWAALWVWRSVEDVGTFGWVGRGVALGALPWLHTKFVVLLAIFAAALAIRLIKRPRALVAFATPMAVLGLLWVYSFYVIYGVLDPEAPYGRYAGLYVVTRNIPHGLIGLLFDQKFGLLFYSPIYLVAIAGAWLMVRQPETRYLGAVLIATVVLFSGSSSRLYMFWGGASAPARFLVPILPCLAPMIAVAVASARSPAARALIGLWLVMGVGVGVAGIAWPSRLLLFSDPHGRARVLEALQGGSPLPFVIPTFTDPDWATQVGQLLLWLVAGAIGFAVLLLSARRGFFSAWRLAGVTTVAFVLPGAVLTARPVASVREATSQRGVTDLIWRLDPSRLRVFSYVTLRRASPDRLRQLSTLALRPEPDAAKTAYVTPLPVLPPGSYEAVVSFTSSGLHNGEVAVTAGSAQVVFARAVGSLPSPTKLRFELPVPVRRLSVRIADASTGSAVTRVEIVPLAVDPPRLREDTAVRAIESLNGPRVGLLVYTDSYAYPEGGVFWTSGAEQARVLVAPQGADRIVLTLFTGPRSGNVTVAGAGRVDTVTMSAGTTKEVEIPVPTGQRLVPLSIRSQTSFRPADAERTSADTRLLGCQVRIRLE